MRAPNLNKEQILQLTEFETLDTLKEIQTELGGVGKNTKLDDLVNKYQNICQAYDDWAEEESKRQMNMDMGGADEVQEYYENQGDLFK